MVNGDLTLKFKKTPTNALCYKIIFFNSKTKFKKKIFVLYARKSISKLQIVIEQKRMAIMTYQQHLFFIVISLQI